MLINLNKRFFALCCFSLAIAMRYDGDKVFRIFPSDQHQLETLRELLPLSIDNLDFWTQPSSIGQNVDVRVRAEAVDQFQSFLDKHNIESSVFIDDLQKTIDVVDRLNQFLQREQTNGSIVGSFASHKDINNWLSMQCAKYPSVTKCGSWGLSYEGRDMRYIKIGKPSSKTAAKKAIYIVSGMHAREWLGPATIVWIVNQMLMDYGHNATVTKLITTYDWYIEPVVNPDGYEYSRSKDRMWRKTRSKTSNPVCVGVDGNRNFDYHWSGKGFSCSETYPGHKAFSEKETTNIANFMEKQNKTQSGLAFFSVHTYSKIWLLPYGYAKGAKPADYNKLLRAGTVGVDALMAVNQQSWQIGNIVDMLYVAAGNSADWFKGRYYTTYSYALELRGNGFVVPATDIVPSGKEVYSGFIASVNAMQ